MAKGYEEILMGYGARSRVQSTERGSSMCRERNSGADEKRDEEKRKRRSQVRIFQSLVPYQRQVEIFLHPVQQVELDLHLKLGGVDILLQPDAHQVESDLHLGTCQGSVGINSIMIS